MSTSGIKVTVDDLRDMDVKDLPCRTLAEQDDTGGNVAAHSRRGVTSTTAPAGSETAAASDLRQFFLVVLVTCRAVDLRNVRYHGSGRGSGERCRLQRSRGERGCRTCCSLYYRIKRTNVVVPRGFHFLLEEL